MVSGCRQWSGTLWSGYCALLTLSPICFCTACVRGYGHPRDCFWELMKLLFPLASGCVHVCVCVCGMGMWFHPPRSTALPQVTHRAVLTAGKPASTLLHWLPAGPLAWCSRLPPPPPPLSGQQRPALDRWWPSGHADARGLGLHAAFGGGGQQGSLDSGSGCLLGRRPHSGLSSRGSSLGLPRGPESWGAAEADVSVACRGPLGWTTLSLTRFSFQRRWRPGQVGGGSAQGSPGPTRGRGPRVRAWGQGGAQGPCLPV